MRATQHQFVIGRKSGAAVDAAGDLVGILKIERPAEPSDALDRAWMNDGLLYPFIGVVENTGTVTFVLSVLGSSDNGVADAYDPVRIRVDGADAVQVTVPPGAKAAFAIEGKTAVAATGTVALAAVPADGNIVTISDGNVSVTFEFDDNATITDGRTAVAIAGQPLVNLQTAINASALDISAADPVDGSMALTCTETRRGGNVTITKTGANITVTGMAGGVLARAPYYAFRSSVQAARGVLSISTYGGNLSVVPSVA